MGLMGRIGLIGLIGRIVMLVTAIPRESPDQFVFPIEPLRQAEDSAVMLLVGDLNTDGETDFLLMSDGGTVAYDHRGKLMWRCSIPPRYKARPSVGWVRDDPDGRRPMQSDLHGCVADVDADRRNEFVFLDLSGHELVILAGRTGAIKRRLDLRQVFGWDHQGTHVLAARLFRKDAPTSIVITSHPAHVPFQGKDHVLAFDASDPRRERSWRHDDLFGICYAPTRAADLDGDGWDEVIAGLEAFDRTGKLLWRVDGKSDQYTTLQIGDILPDPGLEVVIGAYGHAGTDRGLYVNGIGVARRYELSQNTHSAHVGRFFPDRPQAQLLIRNNTHTRREDVRDHRIVDLNASEGSRELTVKRLETAWKDNVEDRRAMAEYPRPIDWDGDGEMEILAIERHVPNPRASVHRWRTGERLMLTEHRGCVEAGVRVCDVRGDGREEVIVWNEREVAVYANTTTPRARVAPRRRDRLYMQLKSTGNVLYNAP